MTNNITHAKKSLGQHFLTNEHLCKQLVDFVAPQGAQTIIEIGPGLGALSKQLINYSNLQLHLVEIDQNLITTLTKELANDLANSANFSQDNLQIHHADALKFNYALDGQQVRLVGNLPYNITTPLLFYLAKFNNISDMHFMVQQEVAERICSTPNHHNYGRLSIMLQYQFTCTNLLNIPPSCFTPPPKVNSSFIRLTPITPPLDNIDLNLLDKIVKQAFSKRRKTIANSLANLVPLQILDNLHLDYKLRAENLSVADYVNITKIMQSLI